MILRYITGLLVVVALVAFAFSCGDDDDNDGGSGDGGIDASLEGGADSDSDADGDSGTDDDGGTEGDSGTQIPSECDNNEAFNPTAELCVDCSHLECGAPGEFGLYKTTTLTGTCICDTDDGYFYSISEQKAVKCDTDKDGWTTIVAKQFIEGKDSALREVAHCPLRIVGSLVLEPESENSKTATVEIEPLPLYEASARDRDSELTLDSNAPQYGGRHLEAKELNSFTKACVNTIADYNANAVPDIEEWEGHEDMEDDFGDYAKYAYFLELNRGWYEAPDNAEDNGSYHIKERSRLESSDEWNQVPFDAYENNGLDSYWRECLRRADPAFDDENPSIGFDFAWACAENGAEMFHHSQFKCVQVRAPGEDADLINAPHILGEVELSDYTMNTCSSTGSQEPQGFDEDASETYNAANSVFSCQEKTSTQTGDVAWVSALYRHYKTNSEYRRGCVNECVEYDVWPGLSSCAGQAECDTELDDFGKGKCGCKGNYKYPECVDCKDKWDIFTGCDTCLGNWDPEIDCIECLEGWDLTTGCASCTGNWDINTSCTTCVGNFDETQNCTVCYDDDIFGHWTGDTCEDCMGNWNPLTGCTVCLNHWTDKGDDCGTCPADKNAGGVWNKAAECDECVQRKTPVLDGGVDTDPSSLAFGFWDKDTNCTTCLDLWDTAQKCAFCSLDYYKEEDNSGLECRRSKDFLDPAVAQGDSFSWGNTKGSVGPLTGGATYYDCSGNTTTIGPRAGSNMIVSHYASNGSRAEYEVDLTTYGNEYINHIQSTMKLTTIHFGAYYNTCAGANVEMGVEQYLNDTYLHTCTSGPMTSDDNWVEYASDTCAINTSTNKLVIYVESGGTNHGFFDDLVFHIAMD